MYILLLLPQAKADIKHAFHWYSQHNNDLGNRFLKEFKKKSNQIRSNPLAFSLRYENVRMAKIDSFPFMIHYVVETNEIIISAIFHTSQSPDKWGNR